MKKIIYSVFTMVFLAGMAASTPVHAVTHTVQVGNYYFNPSTLNVDVGDVIQWVWVAGNHTTTSTTIPSGAASWNAPINSSNTTYSYTVTVAGTYNYVCTPHAGMGMVGSFVATGAAPFMTVTPSNMNVSPDAGSTNFSVSSNVAWTASSNQTWCTVTPSGNGNGTITATYSQNTSFSVRVAAITVSGSGVPNEVVTVTQAGAVPTLSVTPSVQNVTESAGTTDFSVTSNTSWTASSDAAWCVVTNSGTGNGTIEAAYEENITHTERTANITVTVSGLSPVVVQVVQDGSTVGIPSNDPNSLRIYPNPVRDVLNIRFDNPSGNARFSLIDLSGKTVQEFPVTAGNELSMQVGDLPGGYYFVRMTSPGKTVVRRVILAE